jgi:glucose/arabinose dehydrogenase
MYRRLLQTTLALLPLCAAALPAVKLEMVVEKQLQAPTSISHAGDGSGRLFICEQRGQIRVFKEGVLLPAPFLDISGLLVPERVGFDERGLLGLAFHPDYESTVLPGAGRFYVFYSAPSTNAPGTAQNPVDASSVVVEYRVSPANPDLADPDSARLLLRFDKPQFNHNGGQLAFGPEGLLYISTGDGGSANDNNAGHTGGSSSRPTDALGNAQDRTNLMGKILRIDPLANDGPGGQYGIPGGNPFLGEGNGVREEIYAYGLRNPWRFSFDVGPGNTGTGRLFAADVGQGQVEEVNIITQAGNYGWRNREGTFAPGFSTNAPPPSVVLIDPIGMYAHPGVILGSPALPQIGVSITGGFVYRGSAIPGLDGAYVFADWSQNGTSPLGTLLALEEQTATDWSLSTLDVEGGNPIPWFINSLGVDENGEIYLAAKKTRAVSAQDGGFPAGSLLKMVAQPEPVALDLGAAADTTLYSANEVANARGAGLFVGTGGNGGTHHALIRFDLSTLPANATVQSAELTLTVDQAKLGAIPVSAHRVLGAWGEGTSVAPGGGGGGALATAGDATWIRRVFPSVSWTSPGGDYAAGSATQTVDAVGNYLWTSPGLASDVQAWLATPTLNQGWLLLAPGTLGPSKRLVSREGTPAASRPSLRVTYLPGPPALSRRETWERQHFFRGQFIDPAADPDADGTANLLEYAFDQDPAAADLPGASLRVVGRTVHFLRDPRALDLTYRLQTNDDLTDDLGWTTLVESANGTPVPGAVETTALGKPNLLSVALDLTGDPALFVRVQVRRSGEGPLLQAGPGSFNTSPAR